MLKTHIKLEQPFLYLEQKETVIEKVGKFFVSTLPDAIYPNKSLTKQDIMTLLDKGYVDTRLIADYWVSKRTDMKEPFYVHNIRTIKLQKQFVDMVTEDPGIDIDNWESNWNSEISNWEDWASKFVPMFQNRAVEFASHSGVETIKLGTKEYIYCPNERVILSDREAGNARTYQEINDKVYVSLVHPVYMTPPKEKGTDFGAKVPVDGSKAGKNPSIQDRKKWFSIYSPDVSTSRMSDEKMLETMEEVVNDLIVNEPPQIQGVFIATNYMSGMWAVDKNGVKDRIRSMDIPQPMDIIQSSAIVARCDGGVFNSEQPPFIDNSQMNDDFILWEIEPVLKTEMAAKNLQFIIPYNDEKLGKVLDVLKEIENADQAS